MSIEKEIEFKNELTQTEFEQLVKVFQIKPTDFFTQINHYFDTTDLKLRKKHAMLRVRIKNQTYELTLKEPADIGLIETNQLIDESIYKDLLEKKEIPNGIVKERIKSLINEVKLSKIAELQTKRVSFPYYDAQLFLDISTYYNQTDYELELEVNEYDSGLKLFNSLLQEYNIPRRIAKSKIERAFNYYQKISK